METKELLKQKIEETKLELVKIEFPIAIVSHVLPVAKTACNGEFVINKKHEPVKISAYGCAYFNTRIRNRTHGKTPKISKEEAKEFSWKSFTSKHKTATYLESGGNEIAADQIWYELQEHINNAHALLVERNCVKDLYASVYNGTVVGILTKNYDHLSHKLIYDEIERVGLANEITGFVFSNDQMLVNMRLNDKDQKTSTSIQVINGHSGYKPLKFDVVVRQNKYEYIVPKEHFDDEKDGDKIQFMQKSRHMSQINKTFDNLLELFKKAGNMNFVERMTALNARELYFVIDNINLKNGIERTKNVQKIFDEVLSLVQSGFIESGYELFTTFSSYSSKRGYKKSTERILNPVIKYLLEVNFKI